VWQLPANDGDNCIHGGPAGARWQVFRCVAQAADRVTLAWTFREAEDGFPGDAALEVTYALQDPGTIAITWEARVSGRATVLSFTTHPFFNLEGDGEGSPDGHRLWVDAPHVLRIDAGKRPTGDLDPVDGTALDLRAGRTLGEAVRALGAGIDHCYVPPAATGLRQLARVQAPGSGIGMQVWSDQPSLQVYTGHGLDGSLPRHAGKQGRVYGPGAGFCLEPQQFPDAPNHPHFPSTVVPVGGVQRGRIEYRFGAGD
jgi:aldose 1-epimerase